jgi:MobA-like NTP transferase domain
VGVGGRTVVALSGPSLVILAAGRARRYGGVKQLAPIGKHGEGVIDLLASDAYAAGFDDIVIVVNADTGPMIEQHVSWHWPKGRKVTFAIQSKLRGTVEAVLAAESSLDLSKPFGVSNADDLYGREAFMRLGAHLAESPEHCLVGFELDRALVGNLQVSRGTCMVEDGVLTDIIERRNVHATNEGYDADDGLQPESLSPLTTVSMNLWGFQPSIVPYMHKAIEAHDFSEESEIQLSTFVGQLLKTEKPRFDVLQTRSRCIGVTHAQDLAVAQLLVRLEIEVGQRPEYAFAEGSTTTPPAVD